MRASDRLTKSGLAAANGKAALVQITATEMAAPLPVAGVRLLSDAL